MNRIGVISEEEYKRMVKIGIEDGLLPKGSVTIYKAFKDAHREYIDQVMKQLGNLGYDLKDRELKVYTSFDPAKQEALNKYLYTNKYRNWVGQELSPTVAVVDVKDGHVIAIGGGNAKTKKLGVIDGFSYPVNGLLQPGSTIKPIIDYAPALQLLKYSMYNTTLNDKPIKYSSGQSVYNFDMTYTGVQTLARHLQGSRNSPAIQLMQQVGVERAYTFANDLGLNIPSDKWFESGAIGAMNIPMVDLANAYASIANMGIAHDLTYIYKVTDKQGNVLWEHDKKGKAVMDPAKAYELVDSLRQVVQDQTYGFGRWAYVKGYDIAGKTGTNNYAEDEKLGGTNLAPSVAFAGITPDVSIMIHLEGTRRDRGLKFPEETNIPAYMFKEVLPMMSSDTSKFTTQ